MTCSTSPNSPRRRSSTAARCCWIAKSGLRRGAAKQGGRSYAAAPTTEAWDRLWRGDGFARKLTLELADASFDALDALDEVGAEFGELAELGLDHVELGT